MVFAFIGFGELGTCLAEQLSRSGHIEVRAYAPPRASAGAAQALQERLERGRAQRLGSLAEAVAGAGAVVSVVPSSAALKTAKTCAPLLADGSLYVDLTAASLADTEAAAALFESTAAHYVDGAVLGTVATSGAEVPIVLSGLGTVQALNTATIRSQVTGLLQTVNFVEGQQVHRGDTLAQIDPRPYEAKLTQAAIKR